MSFSKNGIVNFADFNECITEPDGSLWSPCFYHSNPASQLFSSSDSFANGVLKENRYFNFNICKILTSWEFLGIQQNTQTSTPIKVRWKQNKSPFTAVYEDVTPSAVIRITTSGYTDAGTTYGGGLYVLNSSTYLCCANTTKGNWFGALGSWSKWNGGIPGFCGQPVTTGVLQVFVRIDNSMVKIHKNTKSIEALEIIEY